MVSTWQRWRCVYGAATGGAIGSMVLPGIGTISGATIKGVRDGVALGGALGLAGAAVDTWGSWI